MWRAFDTGVDAVAGSIEFDPDELHQRPFQTPAVWKAITRRSRPR